MAHPDDLPPSRPGGPLAAAGPHGPGPANRPRGPEVVRLRRGPDHADANDELARLVAGLRATGPSAAGADADPPPGRVGLAGVLEDLDRTAVPCRVPGRARTWGFRWDAADQQDRRWFPQGISTSADHDPGGLTAGRPVLLTSAYAKPVDGPSQGARITVVDLSDRSRPRYRHVLLVEAVLHRDDPAPHLELRPVRVHAGGIVWHGPWLNVAATAAGLVSFRTADILRLPAGGSPQHLRVRGRDAEQGTGTGTGTSPGVDAFGYRYVLPVAFRYESEPTPGGQAFRFSFVSLAHDAPERPAVVAGEYARTGMSSRLAVLPVDPATGLLREDEDGVVRGRTALEHGPRHMQGALMTDRGWFLTTSHGQHRGGTIWSGRPSALRARRSALPPGPEDLAYAPGTGSLWTLTEHPGARYVVEVDTGSLACRRPRDLVTDAVAWARARFRLGRRGEHR